MVLYNACEDWWDFDVILAPFYQIDQKERFGFCKLLFDLLNDQMSNMLTNGSLSHDDSAMDVQETNNFQFSEEPSLEKM